MCDDSFVISCVCFLLFIAYVVRLLVRRTVPPVRKTLRVRECECGLRARVWDDKNAQWNCDKQHTHTHTNECRQHVTIQVQSYAKVFVNNKPIGDMFAFGNAIR